MNPLHGISIIPNSLNIHLSSMFRLDGILERSLGTSNWEANLATLNNLDNTPKISRLYFFRIDMKIISYLGVACLPQSEAL